MVIREYILKYTDVFYPIDIYKIYMVLSISPTKCSMMSMLKTRQYKHFIKAIYILITDNKTKILLKIVAFTVYYHCFH